MTTVAMEEDLRADTYFGARVTAYHRNVDKIVYRVPDDSLLSESMQATRFSIRALNTMLTTLKGSKPTVEALGLPNLDRRYKPIFHMLDTIGQSISNLKEWVSSRGKLLPAYPREKNKGIHEAREFHPNYTLVRNSFAPASLPSKEGQGNLVNLSKAAGVLSLVMFEKYGTSLPRIKDVRGAYTAEKVHHTATLQ